MNGRDEDKTTGERQVIQRHYKGNRLILRCFIWIGGLSCLLLIGACRSPSDEDGKRFSILREKYKGDFSFEMDGDLYLKARLQRNRTVNESELIEIYRMFFFEEGYERRRKTTFVYLNFYDFSGGFQYQIAYDPRQGRFVRSNAEYY